MYTVLSTTVLDVGFAAVWETVLEFTQVVTGHFLEGRGVHEHT